VLPCIIKIFPILRCLNLIFTLTLLIIVTGATVTAAVDRDWHRNAGNNKWVCCMRLFLLFVYSKPFFSIHGFVFLICHIVGQCIGMKFVAIQQKGKTRSLSINLTFANFHRYLSSLPLYYTFKRLYNIPLRLAWFVVSAVPSNLSLPNVY